MKVPNTLAFYLGPVMPLRADGAPMEKVYQPFSIVTKLLLCSFENENLDSIPQKVFSVAAVLII